MRLKRPVTWFMFLPILIALSVAAPHGAYGQEETPPATEQQEDFDEGLFEDAETETKKAAPAPVIDPAAPPPPAQRSISLQGTIRLNYYLYPTKEQLQLTYKFTLAHQCTRPKELEQPLKCAFNGNTPVAVTIQGQLAQWKGGQCQLQVKIPDMPFGVVYAEEPDGSATIKTPTLGPVQEEWESHCSFANDPDFAFNTIGAPEEWIGRGLEKTKAVLEQLTFKVGTFETATPFTASAEESNDDIGRAEVVVEGMIVTSIVQPETAKTAQN